MTGFGRAENTAGNLTVLVEIKSLNGKQLELSTKLPPLLKSFEFDIRNQVAEQLQRGTVDCVVTLKQNGAARPVALNTDLIKAYHNSLNELSKELNLDMSQVLSALLRLPEVVLPVTDVLNDEGWQLVRKTLAEAMGDLNLHRSEEGAVLQKDLSERIGSIARMQTEVEKLAPNRQGRIREGIQKKLDEWVGKENTDANRLEQELVYYVEKIDISEEMVRLKTHCDYFFSILNDNDASKGKKLGFLLQEIGREINTTGAKAYDSDIQKLVVLMKDELEKAKEQVLNVL